MTIRRRLPSDIRQAVRRLAHAPAFTAVCVLTLALGIGGNTAVFTLIDQVMLKPLPVSHPSELLRLGDGDDCCVNTGLAGSFSLFSYELYRHLRDNTPQFSSLAAFQALPATVTVGRPSVDAPGSPFKASLVSGNYFQMFGLGAAAGRPLSMADDRPGAPPVAVMSYRAWTQAYDASPAIVGASLLLNGVPTTIVGVAPEGFFGEMLRPDPPDFWIPLSSEPLVQPQSHLLDAKGSNWLYVIGRLRTGVEKEPLQAQLTGALQQWIRANLDLPQADRARVPEQHIVLASAANGVGNLREAVRPSLTMLQAIAMAVLLIACANLANLLLARGVARRTETAVRIALGAPRSRIVVQGLLEAVLLACAGGALGLAIAYVGARAIVEMTFAGATFVPFDAAPSATVVGFAFAVSLATGMLFGAAPAVLASRSDPIDALRGARAATEFTGRIDAPDTDSVFFRVFPRPFFRVFPWLTFRVLLRPRALVALQVALSLALVVCAGLLARSLQNLQRQDFGFRTEGRAIADLAPSSLSAIAPDGLEPIYRRLPERLKEIPGIAGAAFSLYSPMSGDNWSSRITVDGRATSERLSASWNRVSPHYFDVIGTPVLRGRAIDERDRPGAPRVAVVNQTFAKRFFGEGDPIGRRIGFAGRDGSGPRVYEIVGVVGDAKYQDARSPAYATFFLPFLQDRDDPLSVPRSQYPHAIELRLDRPVQSLEPALRHAAAEVDRRLVVTTVMTMARQVELNFNIERLIARLAVVFGSTALLLACLGLYGVTAHSVSRRTREIGIRMAVGASRGRVVRTILGGALAQLAVGLALGVPAALAAGRLLQSTLFGVGSSDPTILAGAAAVLAACALIAGFIPARRAATIDPMRALRLE